MLQLQRASAGSGKTYMLAKKFIEYFISVKEENGSRRLRHPRELRDALCHILAITFTNKATNEMKLRIVDKLDALASWTDDIPINKIDYLSEFCENFRCKPSDIASICRSALNALLSDYGDFKVSTIDSFFQTVLRTFAYEADLDDTYQLELDSNYVTQMGLDTTLDAVETDSLKSDGVAWICDMMEQKAASGTGWNIFQKKNSKYSIYGQVLKASSEMANEDFKEIREQLDHYFEQNPNFYATFHKLRIFYENDLRKKHEEMRSAAKAVADAFDRAGLDINEFAGQYLAGRVLKMSSRWTWDQNRIDVSFKIPQFTRKGSQTRVFNPKADNPLLNTPVEDEIEDLAIKMYQAFDEWRTELLSDKMSRWKCYSSTMPFVGLMQCVRNNVREFLNDSNIVELGETNSILNRIIGDDDAPFIYERMGSRLEHFLIDEFQDTSRLQWNNLRPLVAESEGKGFDNLIIGDAKQSIYRFRNADSSLITEKVPKQFADTCYECGNTPAENTNWRSSRRIVEFNNLFFRFLTRQLSPSMERLYANTVQPPHHNSDYGFVKVQLFDSKDENGKPSHYDEIPEMIIDMLARGYSMHDIAILVDTREQGAMMIESIMAYNRHTSGKKIDFISADSLSIGESPAVQTIVAILEAINNGTRAKLRPKEEWRQKGVGDWSKLKADFSFFAQSNPDTPLSELMNRFLKGDYDPDAIQKMIASMTATVLPALTENIIRNFISIRMRQSEAPFIAAFQDCVLEFCEGKYADISSFLNWWNSKGCHRSISSPEDADAVQIMTIHKSKGLEFRCVIIPHFKQTTLPSRYEREWLWIKPDLHEGSDITPIPWMPVWSDKILEETPHADVYEEYLSKYLSDKVNMAYVALTRAIDELYIFTPAFKKTKVGQSWDNRIGEYLWQLGMKGDGIISEIKAAFPQDTPYIPNFGLFEMDEDNLCWSFGNLPTREEVVRTSASRSKKESLGPSIPLEEYRCSEKIPSMLYQDPAAPSQETLPDKVDTEDEEASDSEESRLYGELMHCIMEHIGTHDDIAFALKKAKARGLISFRDIPKYQEEIEHALMSVEQYGWFEPGQNVINERGIAAHGKLQRPDRLILKEDGTAVIVDYKFGSHRNDKAYTRQVSRYAKTILSTGIATRCEAFVWYVTLGIVLPLTSQTNH